MGWAGGRGTDWPAAAWLNATSSEEVNECFAIRVTSKYLCDRDTTTREIMYRNRSSRQVQPYKVLTDRNALPSARMLPLLARLFDVLPYVSESNKLHPTML